MLLRLGVRALARPAPLGALRRPLATAADGRSDLEKAVAFAEAGIPLAAVGSDALAQQPRAAADAADSGVAGNPLPIPRELDALTPAVLENAGNLRRLAKQYEPHELCLLANKWYQDSHVDGAVALWRAGWEGGHMASGYSLATYLYRTEQDVAAAVEIFRVLAENGHEWGMYGLANALRNGIGAPKDPAEAAQWLEKATVGEFAAAPAFNDLATMHADGEITGRPDDAEAKRWYLRAAIMNDPLADLMLGLWAVAGRGLGGVPDPAAAREHFVKSAQGGNALALFHLGLLHHTGSDAVPQDMEQAAEYYKAAARGRIRPAFVNLATMILNGEGGLEQDEGKARELLTAALPDELAARILEDLGPS